MGEHHPFGPSRLYLYTMCPGAYMLAVVLKPEPEANEAAQEGEWGHVLTAAHFSRSQPEARTHAVPPELQELVDRCIAYGEAVAASMADPRQYAEVWLSLKVYDAELYYGTADLVTIGRPLEGGHLMAVVTDWKFGRAPLNDAAISAQLAAYGAMALSDNAEAEVVQVRVYQPRYQREYKREYTRADLPQLMEGIRRVISRAQTFPMTLNPSAEACGYCPCLAVCPAARSKAEALVPTDAPAVDLAGLTPARLAELKGRVEYAVGQMEALKKGVNAEIQTRHRTGENVPGWRVVFRRGRRKIPVPQLAFERAGLDLDVFMDSVEVSPTKLERLYLEANRNREDKPTLKALKAEFEGTMGDAVERAPEYPIITKE